MSERSDTDNGLACLGCLLLPGIVLAGLALAVYLCKGGWALLVAAWEWNP